MAGFLYGVAEGAAIGIGYNLPGVIARKHAKKQREKAIKQRDRILHQQRQKELRFQHKMATNRDFREKVEAARHHDMLTRQHINSITTAMPAHRQNPNNPFMY